MCACTPGIETPFCGRPGCQPPGKESPLPRVIGIGRMFDNDRAVLVMMDRKPNDHELRVLHERIRLATS